MGNTKELSQEEIELYSNKAKEISTTLKGVAVHPIVVIHPETLERKVCYVREPSWIQKLDAMDKSMELGVYKSGFILFEQIVIKEHSDAVMFSDTAESDTYKLGAVTEVIGLVKMYQNQFKKK